MLADPLRHESLRLAGRKQGGEGNGAIEVRFPYDGRLVGTVPRASAAQIRTAIDIAHAYRPKLTRYERQRILMRTAEALVARKDELSRLITLESGLCLKDSLYEVGRAYDVFSLAAQLCIQDDGQTFSCDLTPHGKARKIFTLRQPLNAIAAITPFNHPLNMVAHKLAPAFATNNCVVLKPTELTPLTALFLADMLYESGLPPEMLSVITGRPEDIGDELVTSPKIDLITFTGSVRVGKAIAAKAGYKRLVLELGGNDPLIVLDDADPDRAAELAVAGATKNSGQRCTAVKRIIVTDRVAEAFVPRVLARAKQLNCGDPLDPAVDIGTVISERAATLFQNRVSDAVAHGAELLHGNDRQGALYPPTVLDRVPADCELVREETFGPVIPIIRVPDLDAAIGVANATAYGLSSGVCTSRLEWITRCIDELQVGTVNVWEVPGYRIEMSPFGGIKDSGLGYKEGVAEAMKSFTNVKTYSLPWPG